jgi:hypothetical protein
VARWGEFERQAPEIAAAGRRMWTEIDLAYIGTVSSSGWPRIHPIVVVFEEDDLMFSIGEQTPKFGDLQRDARCALHTPHLGADDEELFVRGRVLPENDEAGRTRFDAAAPYALQEHEFVYALDLERALWTRWWHPGQPDTRPMREFWRDVS